MSSALALQIFDFISSNIHIIGWAGLGVLAWKVRGALDRFITSAEVSEKRAQETYDMTAEVKSGVDLIQTNHLAHVEKDLGSLSIKQDEANKILASIDKGISILVDRREV